MSTQNIPPFEGWWPTSVNGVYRRYNGTTWSWPATATMSAGEKEAAGNTPSCYSHLIVWHQWDADIDGENWND